MTSRLGNPLGSLFSWGRSGPTEKAKKPEQPLEDRGSLTLKLLPQRSRVPFVRYIRGVYYDVYHRRLTPSEVLDIEPWEQTDQLRCDMNAVRADILAQLSPGASVILDYENRHIQLEGVIPSEIQTVRHIVRGRCELLEH